MTLFKDTISVANTPQSFVCPRRESLAFLNPEGSPTPDSWSDDKTCGYCGSMRPEDVIALIESGSAEIGTTDKNYKIYVRRINSDDTETRKFYFQHFSVAQCVRFIELYNERKIQFSGGFGFSVFPYFMRAA